jgi:hypothetical protein
MLDLTEIARRASAQLQQVFGEDPLQGPLSHASDSSIDQALEEYKLGRADLFILETAFAPHRRRLSAMLAAEGLSPAEIERDYWPELKLADTRCARCMNAEYCDWWVRQERKIEAPESFCPNAMTFEQIKERIFDARLSDWVHRTTAR